MVTRVVTSMPSVDPEIFSLASTGPMASTSDRIFESLCSRPSKKIVCPIVYAPPGTSA